MSDISLCQCDDRKCGQLEMTCRRALERPEPNQSWIIPDCWNGECNHYYHKPSAEEVLAEWNEQNMERRREAFS